ncbi:hypothetical protein EDD85DRAFT_794376 [Armillaria nabsnona]|nr:hypothetical protein EDD85DRAFT_794376 [Armillaria nabsnona]
MYREFVRGKIRAVVPASLYVGFSSTSVSSFYTLPKFDVLLNIKKDSTSRKLGVVAIRSEYYQDFGDSASRTQYGLRAMEAPSDGSSVVEVYWHHYLEWTRLVFRSNRLSSRTQWRGSTLASFSDYQRLTGDRVQSDCFSAARTLMPSPGVGTDMKSYPPSS